MTSDEVMMLKPCNIGDIAKIVYKGEGRVTGKKNTDFLHKIDKTIIAECVGIHRWHILFNNGIRNICVNKTDLATGQIEIVKGRKK